VIGDQRQALWDASMRWLAVARQWPDVPAEFVMAARLAADGVAGESGSGGAREIDVAEGYARWASTYGEYDTPLTKVEGPLVRALTADLPRGVVLDAGCGTGRHAAHLVGRHSVIGVDSSAEMLAAAATRVRGVEWRRGDLDALPVAEDSVDAALCALAIGHMPDVGPPLRELARVVRPGGRIIITELHPAAVLIGGHALVQFEGDWRAIRKHAHLPSAYMRAFAENGVEVRACHELLYTAEALGLTEVGTEDATVQALTGWPALLAWDLRVG
jgi:ubiquinone/menaquinone biosynthesis C-methylase UbiE